MNKETLIGLGCVVGVLIIFYGFVELVGADDGVDRTLCPYEVLGSEDAELTIKYLDSSSCVWCWFETPILEELIEEKGDSVRIEKYDLHRCSDVQSYGIRATPGWVFETNGQEVVSTGFLSKEELGKVICGAVGDCY